MMDTSTQRPPSWPQVDIHTLMQEPLQEFVSHCESELANEDIDTPQNLSSAPESSEFESLDSDFSEFAIDLPALPAPSRESLLNDNVHVYDYTNDTYDNYDAFGFLYDGQSSGFELDANPDQAPTWTRRCTSDAAIGINNLTNSSELAEIDTQTLDLDNKASSSEGLKNSGPSLEATERDRAVAEPEHLYGLGIHTKLPTDSDLELEHDLGLEIGSLPPSPSPPARSSNIEITPGARRARISAKENKAAALEALATLEDGGDSDGDEDFSPDDEDSDSDIPSKASSGSSARTHEQLWAMELETEPKGVSLPSTPQVGVSQRDPLLDLSIAPLSPTQAMVNDLFGESVMEYTPRMAAPPLDESPTAGRISKRGNERRGGAANTQSNKGQIVVLPTPSYAEDHRDAGQFLFLNFRNKSAWRRRRR